MEIKYVISAIVFIMVVASVLAMLGLLKLGDVNAPPILDVLFGWIGG